MTISENFYVPLILTDLTPQLYKSPLAARAPREECHCRRHARAWRLPLRPPSSATVCPVIAAIAEEAGSALSAVVRAKGTDAPVKVVPAEVRMTQR